MKTLILLLTGTIILTSGCHRSMDDLAELTSKFHKSNVLEYVAECSSSVDTAMPSARPLTVEYIFVKHDSTARMPYYYRIEDAGGIIGMYFENYYVETRPEDKSAILFPLEKDTSYFRTVMTFPHVEHALPFVLARFEQGLRQPGLIQRISDTLIGEAEVSRFRINFQDIAIYAPENLCYELWINHQTKLPVQYIVKSFISLGVSSKKEERTYRLSSFTTGENPSKALDISSLPSGFSVHEYTPNRSFGVTIN